MLPRMQGNLNTMSWHNRTLAGKEVIEKSALLNPTWSNISRTKLHLTQIETRKPLFDPGRLSGLFFSTCAAGLRVRRSIFKAQCHFQGTKPVPVEAACNVLHSSWCAYWKKAIIIAIYKEINWKTFVLYFA